MAEKDRTDFETLNRLLVERHSCRAFREGAQVPDAMIEQILAAAQRTASWCNAQPWQVFLTKGEATNRFRDALLAHVTDHPPRPDIAFPSDYKDVYLDRRRECGFQLYAAVGVARGDKEGGRHQFLENYRLFGAPHVAIITTEEALGPYGAIDCGGYVANFLLAAQALGIAAIPQAALATHCEFVRDWFKIAANRQVVCGISFGFEETTNPANGFRTSRADIADAVTILA